VVVHISGGTITNVIAGNGLTGGGSNGSVTLGLNGSYKLPQSCSDGQIVKWDATNGVWSCATDQTYTNGAGLDLNGNTFSLNSKYQLPQGCSSGQHPSWEASTSRWTCSDPSLPRLYYKTLLGTINTQWAEDPRQSAA
jgi:hypothetical protein